MDRRESILALVGLLGAATVAQAAVKYPFEIRIRPVDNGYLVSLTNLTYPAEGETLKFQNAEVFVPDPTGAGAVTKQWLDLLKSIP